MTRQPADVDEKQPRLNKGLFLAALVFLAIDLALLAWATVMKFWSW
jgi:hypothetical protein